MGILDIFKGKKEKELAQTPKTSNPVKVVAKNKVKSEKKEVKKVSQENTGDAYKVLVKRMTTEKTTRLEGENKVTFVVSHGANKIQVKDAILKVYGVNPIKVRIVNTMGKGVRFGQSLGKRKDWKKAIVTLKKGEALKIEE